MPDRRRAGIDRWIVDNDDGNVAIALKMYFAAHPRSRRILVVCSPSSGGARSCRSGDILKRMALAISGTVPEHPLLPLQDCDGAITAGAQNMRQTHSCVGHLPGSSRAPQLGNNLDDLPQMRGPHRFALAD